MCLRRDIPLKMYSRLSSAGWSPPINSTRISTSGLSRMSDESVVISPSGGSIALGLEGSLTRTPLSSTGHPTMSLRWDCLRLMICATTAPNDTHSEETDTNGIFSHNQT